MAERVVLAMSGGVDSSASAVLLKEQGYEVTGLFMRTGVHAAAADERPDRKKGCCSAVDAGDARRVADKLDIPFYALDFEARIRPRHRLLRRRVPGRPDAEPVRRVQHLAEVRPALVVRRDARRRLHRHRPLCPRRPGSGRGRTAPRRRSGQGPVLRPARHPARRARPGAIPDRRHAQGRRAGRRPAGRPRRGRQAGQRRNLLRAGRRPRPARARTPSGPGDGGDGRRSGRGRAGDARRQRAVYRRPAQGAGHRHRPQARTCWRSCPRRGRSSSATGTTCWRRAWWRRA